MCQFSSLYLTNNRSNANVFEMISPKIMHKIVEIREWQSNSLNIKTSFQIPIAQSRYTPDSTLTKSSSASRKLDFILPNFPAKRQKKIWISTKNKLHSIDQKCFIARKIPYVKATRKYPNLTQCRMYWIENPKLKWDGIGHTDLDFGGFLLL